MPLYSPIGGAVSPPTVEALPIPSPRLACFSAPGSPGSGSGSDGLAAGGGGGTCLWMLVFPSVVAPVSTAGPGPTCAPQPGPGGWGVGATFRGRGPAREEATGTELGLEVWVGGLPTPWTLGSRPNPREVGGCGCNVHAAWFPRGQSKPGPHARGQRRVWTARGTPVLFPWEPQRWERCRWLCPEAPYRSLRTGAGNGA